MDNYENLKEHTFLSLIEDNESSISLIMASLIISYYCERCIKEINNNSYTELIDKKFKPLISQSYLKDCSNCLNFSNKKINKLNPMQKIKLIRNKLAHGDFVIDPLCENIIIKIVIKGEEIETSIPIHNIVELANYLAEYSRYPKSDKKRESIYYKDGIEYKFIDYPKTNYGRNSLYERKFEKMVGLFLNAKCRRQALLFNQNIVSQKLDYKYFCIDLCYRETDRENGENIYPTRTAFEWCMLYKLYNPFETDDCCNEFIDFLIDYYRYYIYPLENFLKVEDKNILTLQDDNMFSFENLDITIDEDIKAIEEVGKIKDYNNQFPTLSSKAIDSYNDLDRLLKEEYYPNLEHMENLESYTEDFIKLMGSSTMAKYYEYSKKRSLIEHLRCSIEHGTYDFNNENATFNDDWQNNNFDMTMNTSKLKNIVSPINKDLILKQFDQVYQRSNSKIRKK